MGFYQRAYRVLKPKGKLFPLFKPFIKKGKLFLGNPISLSNLPKNAIFGENLIILAERN